MNEKEEQLSRLLEKHRGERNGLIPILLEVQKEFGYLPKEAMLAVARFLGMEPTDVWGVATFFNQFRLTPLGKNHVKVCMGTACHLAGGRSVLEALERELKIKVGETSDNGQFSLERVACIGCCMLAPVTVIKDKIHPKMSSFKVEESLIPYRQEEKVEVSEKT
ncbi:MAG TPA: NADH-quinone oxidoreductase subunit NuoE [Thermodesulfobacteriota bacterium]|nr:NADH-quinone oxidoreductase subunit NuoE [Thermodesulfobacteriota bacterium]